MFIQESRNKVDGYFRKNGFQLPDTVILDEGAISKQLNIYLIPRIILIDKNFKVQRDGDTISKSSLKKKLQAIIASKWSRNRLWCRNDSRLLQQNYNDRQR